MTRKLISLLAFLVSPVVVWSNNFHGYLSYVDKAEHYIVNDDYKNAQRCYDSAFHEWPKPFAIDLFNDLKCANLNTDYYGVKLIAIRLMGLGCELSFFENPEYLRKFRCTREWKSLMNEYVAIRAKYIKGNNWKLRTEIEQIQVKDQFLRQQDHNYTFLRDSIYHADDTIKASLLAIFKRKFPNEYDYGIFLYNDTTLINHHPLHVTILHNYGKFDTAIVHNANTQVFDFTRILIMAVEKGDMHPEDFALLNDRSGKYMKGYGYGQQALLIKINKRLYYDMQGPAVVQDIENNRKNIGLCTRADGRDKLIYAARANNNGFILLKSLFGISDFGIPFTENQIKKMFVDTGVTMEH